MGIPLFKQISLPSLSKRFIALLRVSKRTGRMMSSSMDPVRVSGGIGDDRPNDVLYSTPVYQQNSVSIHDPLDLNRFKWEPFSARNA